MARDGFTAAADVGDVLALAGGPRLPQRPQGRRPRRAPLLEAGEPPARSRPPAGRGRRGRGAGRAGGRWTTPRSVQALDPAADAEARLQAGSSSQAAMAAMLTECEGSPSARVEIAFAGPAAAEGRAVAEAALLERARALA